MISLEALANVIEAAVPHHSRNVVRPETIARGRTASCFGRSALMGVALLQEGIPEISLSLLISKAHGMQRKDGDHWFGHAELVVDTEDQSGLVVTARGLYIQPLSTTNWWRGVAPSEQAEITGIQGVLPEMNQVRADAALYLGSLFEDQEISSARRYYRAHSFVEGVEQYQRDHPALNVEPLVTVADYQVLYAQLVPRS